MEKYEEREERMSRIQRAQKRKDLRVKWFLTVVFGVASTIPTLLFLYIKGLMNPDGFWQTFAVYGFGVYFLGGLQIVSAIMYVGVLIEIIWEK